MQENSALGRAPAVSELALAYWLQERAATVGFDWPDVAGPLAKVREELAEVEWELAAPDERLVDEIGDLFFAVVNLARKAGIQPAVALERANTKFRERFMAIERLAAARGLDMATAGLEALDQLWDEVKEPKRASS